MLLSNKMINPSGDGASTSNLCLHKPQSFLLSLSLRGASLHEFKKSVWYRHMNYPVTRPQLHLGLTSETDQDASAWFLAVLPQSCLPDGAVTVHFGLVGVGPVLLPLFFLRNTHGQERILLETSLNPYQADLQGLKLLRCLCSQGSYQIHCRDLTTNAEHTFTVPNVHQAKYREAVSLLEAHSPWTATQFVEAQYHLVESWPTLEERYQNLRRPPCQPASFDT